MNKPKINNEQLIEIANYIIDNECTLSVISKKYDLNYKTLHSSLSKRLPRLNKELSEKLLVQFEKNRKLKHSTMEKYSNEDILNISEYICKNKVSIDDAAKALGIDNCSIAQRFFIRLKKLDKDKYYTTKNITDEVRRGKIEKIQKSKREEKQKYINTVNELQEMLRKKK